MLPPKLASPVSAPVPSSLTREPPAGQPAAPDYLLVVQAPAYPLGGDGFAIESAFAAHLIELRERLGARFGRLVLVAPQWTEAQYTRQAAQMRVVPPSSGVCFQPAYRLDVSRPAFWARHLLRVWRLLRRAVARAGVVHSGMSTQLGHPLMFMACLVGWRAGVPVVFMVDIDFRRTSERNRSLGVWNLRQYLVNRYAYDPLKWLQVWLAPRLFDLVLLKSASMVERFGGGRRWVRNFFDTVHREADVLAGQALDRHLERLGTPGRPLEAVFFGRLVPYKGLDRAIEAVRLAREAGHDVRLTLVGDGECRAALEAQVAAAGLVEAVRFVGPRPYGEALFQELERADLALATPLVEDTPRAAFDAMARGLPLLAFDITYFRDLADLSGAVALARWPDAADLARALGALERDRPRLAAMARQGLAFARANTQTIWLERRIDWTLEASASR